MNEATGDLWTFPAEYRCVTTNGIITCGKLVMGAGVALQAKRRFPNLPVKLAGWVSTYGNRAFICKEEGIITLPTKVDWRDDSKIYLIERSLKQVVAIADKFGIASVAMTRPGCGNGKLNWSEVGPLCAFLLDDRFTVLIP